MFFTGLDVACESEDKMMRAQFSAQEQVRQLQTANHESQAYWDDEAELMLAVAKNSNESAEGSKERIEEILEEMNGKSPQLLRKLASHPESVDRLRKAILQRFRADLLDKDQLRKYHAALGEKLHEYYAQEVEHVQKKQIRVRRGETLVKISAEYYHTPRRWTEIYLANQEHIPNWDVLEVGTPLDLYLPKELSERWDSDDLDQMSAD